MLKTMIFKIHDVGFP